MFSYDQSFELYLEKRNEYNFRSTNKLSFDFLYQKCVNNVMKQIMKQCFIN